MKKSWNQFPVAINLISVVQKKKTQVATHHFLQVGEGIREHHNHHP